MAINISCHTLTIFFGILGNFISILCYFAPMVTFYKILQRRSTQNYSAAPYSVALFNSMLYLYYAYLKGHEAFFLFTVNAFGSFIETIYLMLFFTFARSITMVQEAQSIIAINTVGFVCILFLTSTIDSVHMRLKLVGWICGIFSVSVYAAPLNIMRTVIRTKSVKYMTFPLSVCLTLNAIVWFLYGIFSHDYFIAAPNMLGFVFGVAQMIIYCIYRKKEPSEREIIVVADNAPGVVANRVALEACGVEIIEIDENMSHQTNNSEEDEQEEVSGISAGNNTATEHDGEEIVEILEANNKP